MGKMTTNKRLAFQLIIVIIWEYTFLFSLFNPYTTMLVRICYGIAFLLNIPAPAILLWKARIRAETLTSHS